MKKIKNFAFIVFVLLVSCSTPNDIIQINQGTFSDIPENIECVNSIYDDYNSTSPTLGGNSPLCFSSRRNSQGKDFDVVYKSLDVLMSRSNGKLTVSENTNTNLDGYFANQNINEALSKINTGYDELGPNLIWQGTKSIKINNGNYSFNNFIMLYSTNSSGNFDIKFTHNLINDTYINPQEITYLNSTMDDLYPTLTSDSSQIYFCSNRGGNFDIYFAEIQKTNNFINAFSDHPPKTILKDTMLSSLYDDKCPFIIQNLLVFASNRPGGYGGYDLYYSVYDKGKWSAPVNFGEKINTPSDEYRPIVKYFFDEFTNDFMIFSSNRPGGKGGFDLYHVGIKRMIKY